MRRSTLVLALFLPLALCELVQARGDLYDNVASLLTDRYFDEAFRHHELAELIDRFQPEADKAQTLNGEREIVHELLSHIPASHLALLSTDEYQVMLNELRNRAHPTFGFELLERDGDFFVHSLLDGGSAQRSGLLRGDRIVLIDGMPTGRSERLDWRSDDAALPDPAVHRLLSAIGEGIRLDIEREPDRFMQVDLVATNFSAYESMKRSAKIIRHKGEKIAYVHLWFIHLTGLDKRLASLMRGPFLNVSALIIDLRGRGGSADMAIAVLRLLAKYHEQTGKPVLVLIDSMTRSAKEVIAYGVREYGIGVLVGQRTAGAVLPATFKRVGPRTVLMYPEYRLDKYSELIEGIGVAPDVEAEAPGPYSAGDDPILDAALAEAVRLVEVNIENVATESTSPR